MRRDRMGPRGRTAPCNAPGKQRSRNRSGEDRAAEWYRPDDAPSRDGDAGGGTLVLPAPGDGPRGQINRPGQASISGIKTCTHFIVVYHQGTAGNPGLTHIAEGASLI